MFMHVHVGQQDFVTADARAPAVAPSEPNRNQAQLPGMPVAFASPGSSPSNPPAATSVASVPSPAPSSTDRDRGGYGTIAAADRSLDTTPAAAPAVMVAPPDSQLNPGTEMPAARAPVSVFAVAPGSMDVPAVSGVSAPPPVQGSVAPLPSVPASMATGTYGDGGDSGPAAVVVAPLAAEDSTIGDAPDSGAYSSTAAQDRSIGIAPATVPEPADALPVGVSLTSTQTDNPV